MLLVGAERGGVSSTPNQMFEVRTNCLGCHEKTKEIKGQKQLVASVEICVECHSKEHIKMLAEWKIEIKEKLAEYSEVKDELRSILKQKTKTKISPEIIEKTKKALHDGDLNRRIVKFGNGVHNKKYAIMLLNDAITMFEDMMDELEGEK